MRNRTITVILLWMLTWALVWWNPFWAPLWPSILALFSVFLLRKAISGLLTGASAGLLLLHAGNPFVALVRFFDDHLLPSLQSSWNLSVLIFTLLLGGFVALLEKGGGITALLRRLIQSEARNPARSLQWGTYTLGIVCFFDGLANSMLVGKSMSRSARQVGVSGPKLAYIVDSTSSAVACVAVISTWIAYQLSMIREGFLTVYPGADVQPFQLFIRSIPYNFYCWFTLILLAVVIAHNWNIGPMREAEREETPKANRNAPSGRKKRENRGSSSWSAVLPLGFLITGLLAGLYWNGTGGAILPVSMTRISNAFGQADAALVLLCVSALACLVAYVCNRNAIIRSGSDPGSVFHEGVVQLFTPILILISAWILTSTLRELDAVHVLTRILQGNLPTGLYPLLVFVVGAGISFTTGTSWGTMGVLMPLALPVALQLEGSDALVSATIASVFSGAVFGDHCSPLSDTTIVSSISCGIEPVDHVKTQLPYALIVAGTASTAGFLPAGLGLNPWISLLVGAFILNILPLATRRTHPTPHG